MKSLSLKFLALVIFMLLVSGCETEQPAPAPPQAQHKAPAASLFQNPFEPVLTELPTEALAYWRSQDKQPSPLMLFSHHPFLTAIPEELKERAKELATTGNAEKLKKHGSLNRIDPVILTQQTLTAAIDAGLIEEIFWFFPFKETTEQLSMQHFHGQITKTGFLSDEEADALTLKDGVFSGRVRGIPLKILHPEAYLYADEELFHTTRPPIVHIDLSYFRGLYVDAVKTPVYKSLLDTALMIKEMDWHPLAVTLTTRTEEGDIALDARFLMHDFIELCRRPQLLSETMPKVWANRSEAHRLKGLLHMEDSRELLLQNVAEAPDDATVQYDLFTLKMADNQLNDALAILDQAVAKEPGYAFGYLETATFFANKRQFDTALDLLDKAAKHYPENPFIPFNMAQVHVNMKDLDKAEEIIAQLLTLPWSPVYHGQAIPMLKSMSAANKPFQLQPRD